MPFNFSVDDAFEALPASAEFLIRGRPLAQQRNRPGRNRNQYNPNRRQQQDFADTTRALFQAHQGEIPFAPADIPVYVRVVFAFPFPVGVPPRITRRADIDNLGKFLLDALDGDFYADDGQVVNLNAIKIFDNEHGGQGYTLVWIWPDAPAREVIVMDNWMFGVFPQIPLILFNCWDPTTTSTTNNDSSEINSTRLPQLR